MAVYSKRVIQAAVAEAAKTVGYSELRKHQKVPIVLPGKVWHLLLSIRSTHRLSLNYGVLVSLHLGSNREHSEQVGRYYSLR